MEVAKGVTRIVFLTKRYAIKIPTFYSWELFLTGLLANLQEINWWAWTLHDQRLCPVLAYCPGGFWLVMPRAQPITFDELPETSKEFDGLPLDYKHPNFGRLDGRLVLIDYGS
jgi:hypothetical protein